MAATSRHLQATVTRREALPAPRRIQALVRPLARITRLSAQQSCHVRYLLVSSARSSIQRSSLGTIPSVSA